MGYWEVLKVASDPVLQVLLISALGALMASHYFNHLLSPDFRKSLNKVVFTVFTPSLIFSSFANTVSLHDMISWWFMPLNVALTFLIGGIMGWIIVKLFKPNPKLHGLIIAACSSGNLGNLPIVIIPAICDEKGGPFGSPDTCRSNALSYSSFSLAVSGIFIWTFTYQTVRNSSMKYKALHERNPDMIIINKDLDANPHTHLLMPKHTQQNTLLMQHQHTTESQVIVEEANWCSSSVNVTKKGYESLWQRVTQIGRQILEELMAPPTIATILGFVFGGIAWLRNLIIGQNAPLRLIQHTIQLLGDGTIPCITLLLGANLTQGMKSWSVKPSIIMGILVSRFIIQPGIGMLIVKMAANLGFLPGDPLFHYVLVMQYAMPPAMNISTMAQLFDVGEEESSVILLWSYGAAAIALTAWSTFLICLLS